MHGTPVVSPFQQRNAEQAPLGLRPTRPAGNFPSDQHLTRLFLLC